MNSKKLFSFLLVFSIMLTGCGGNDKTATSSEPSDTQKTSELTVDKDGNKEESKDTDSKKQEEETSSSTKNETSSNSTNKTDSNTSKDSGKNNSSSKPSNNSSSSSQKPAKPSKPAPCAHSWKDQYKTVHHDAQYRSEPVYKDEIVYEDRPVYKWQAYWTCNECNQRFENEFDVADHAMYECGGGWTAHEEKVQTGTEQVQVGTNRVQVGTNQVLVKEAWDEQVKTGSVCTKCNAHK